MPKKDPTTADEPLDLRAVAGRQTREVLRDVTRDLRCAMTEREVRDRGEELARIEHEIEEAEARIKAERQRQKELMDDLKLRRKDKAYDVRTKTELRPVTCHWVADFTRDMKVLIRTDTGDELDKRPLTDEDRQTALL